MSSSAKYLRLTRPQTGESGRTGLKAVASSTGVSNLPWSRVESSISAVPVKLPDIQAVPAGRIPGQVGGRRRTTIAPDWLAEAELELRGLVEYSDGDSPPVRDSTIDAAVNLLVACSATAPRPEFGVGRKGQISFDWWGDDNATLTAEVYSDGHTVFSALYGASAVRGRVEAKAIESRDPAEIRFALGRVFEGHD